MTTRNSALLRRRLELVRKKYRGLGLSRQEAAELARLTKQAGDLLRHDTQAIDSFTAYVATLRRRVHAHRD